MSYDDPHKYCRMSEEKLMRIAYLAGALDYWVSEYNYGDTNKREKEIKHFTDQLNAEFKRSSSSVDNQDAKINSAIAR